MTDRDCPFCRIVERVEPHIREIYRNEHVVAFFPLNAATLGHTLVIPRAHVPYIWSLSEDLAAEVARATLRISRAVQRATKLDGLNIIQSNGAIAGQTVFHLHFHVVPRWSDDKIEIRWPTETAHVESEIDTVWEKVRGECSDDQ